MVNEYTANKELFMSMLKERSITVSGVIHLILNLYVLGCGLYILRMSILIGNRVSFWIAAIIFILYSLLNMILGRRLYVRRMYKTLSKINGASEWKVTVTFTDSEVVRTEANMTHKLPYRNFIKYKEFGDSVILIFVGNSVARIYKSAFVEGSWEECKTMLDSLKAQNTSK